MMNEYLNQFIGFTAKQKVLMDAQKYLMEEKLRVTQRNPNEVCLVYATDPKTKEITSIGGSVPNDIINDNFGLWWAEMFRFPVQPPPSIIVGGFIDNSGTSRTVTLADNLQASYNVTTVNLGNVIQFGSGSSPVARSDFNVETVFPTAPEDTFIDISNAVYNSGAGTSTFGSTNGMGGTGTISEIGDFMRWKDSGGGTRFFMWAHDLVAPSVDFVPVQTVTSSWTWQFG